MYKKREPLIIILSGKAKSGKNLVASYIKEYYKENKCIEVAYAYYIKDYLKRMNKYNEQEKNKYRSLLQEFGVEFLSKQINPKFLINRVMEDIEVFSYFYDVIVITDARLIEEIEIPKQKFLNIITIRIENNNNNNLNELEKNHITETGLDNYTGFDYIIENNSTIDDLKKQILEILKGVK